MCSMSYQLLVLVVFTCFQKYESKVYDNVVVGTSKVCIGLEFSSAAAKSCLKYLGENLAVVLLG
jgi:hypothetical protein